MHRAFLALVFALLGSVAQAAPPRVSDDVLDQFAKDTLRVIEEIVDNSYEPVTRGQLVRWGSEGLYRSFREPVPDKLKALFADAKRLDGLTKQELFSVLRDARRGLNHPTRLADGEDVRITVCSMLPHFDPKAKFEDRRAIAERVWICFVEGMGIGAKLQRDPTKEMPRVLTTYRDSPAQKARLQPGDLILESWRNDDLAGKSNLMSTKGMLTPEVYGHLRVSKDSKLNLLIQRDGEKQTRVITVETQDWRRETVFGTERKADGSWNFWLDEKRKIGYIQIDYFEWTAPETVESALKDLSKHGLKGLILDLRFNPGGPLKSAKEIASLFIADGLIGTIRGRDGKESQIKRDAESCYLDFPMAVLINGPSGWGPEMVAACLQDHARAIIVGEPSWGRGATQCLCDCGSIGHIFLTVAVCYRPSGQALYGPEAPDGSNRWGVKPTKGYSLELSPSDTEKLRLRLIENEYLPAPGKKVKFTNPEFKDRQRELALDYLLKQKQ